MHVMKHVKPQVKTQVQTSFIYIYPSIQCTHPDDEYMDFSNQFAFQLTGSTTVALIQLFHSITAMLETNPYVILYSIDFSKAFDSVRHYTLMEKFAALDLPDNIYNWINVRSEEHTSELQSR